MKKKRAYKPKTVVRNLAKDYDLDADINVEFWQKPSQNVVLDLMQILGTSRASDLDTIEPEEFERMDARYFECVSLLIIDTDIEGLDFSTPEKARASFYADHVDWGIFHLATLMYISELTEEYDYLKNLLRRVEMLSDSGTNNKQPENELVPTS